MVRTVARVLGGLAAVLVGLALLVEGMAYLTWRLSPRNPDELARALAFVGRVHGGLGADAGASTDSHGFGVPDRRPKQATGVHHVEEWASDRPRQFAEAPDLAERVARGELPPVEERLPRDPLVIVPPQQTGPYGGTWARFGNAPSDVGIYEARLAYEGLVRWDPMAREILPNLATGWRVEDGGRTYTFRLRHGVRWSDGEPFTAADARFWYDHVLCNKELSPVKPRELTRGGKLVEFETPDDYTIRFRFAEPYGLFMDYIASGGSTVMCQAPAHYLKQFHPDFVDLAKLESMAKAAKLDFWYQLFAQRQEWKAPECPRLWAWVITEPPPAQPVVFERNPYYWKVDPQGDQLPYIDRMTFDIYDTETINLKMINGEAGMQLRHARLENYPLFMANRQRGGYRVLHWIDASAGHNALMPNYNHKDPVMRGILGTPDFRKALSHAINREALNQICCFGVGTPRQMSPPPSSAFADESYAKAYIEYDPAEANSLLDGMGLSARAKDGTRLRPDGKPLTLLIETTDWNNTNMLEMVAADWTAVGVGTRVKQHARNLYELRVHACQVDVAVWSGADELIPLNDPRYFFPWGWPSFQGIEYARWFTTEGRQGEEPPPRMRECMDLYRQIERTVDPDEQVRLFHRILDINKEELWIIGTIGELPAIGLVSNRFRNVPEVAVSGWVMRTPGNTAPECYSIVPENGGEG